MDYRDLCVWYIELIEKMGNKGKPVDSKGLKYTAVRMREKLEEFDAKCSRVGDIDG